MKGRSHRLPTSAPPDDWVDESWTVDCVCGVNFDDGEEMVNCDECGVWVHTRCFRYVKGEASFACDKCKTKNSRNDSEETEVAQLLVELPTKTMRMEKSSPLNHPARRPFRLWSEMPMEEKVHVQGIPGGEPALFGGLSSVFSRELWNCTGYVPKKFNFQYKEFPCWEEKQEADDRLEEENDNPVNKGADVLFSLSKDTVLRMSGMRDQTGESGCDGKSSLKQRKKVEVKDLHNRHLQNGETKERRLLKPIIIHSSKRKKEDLSTSIDRNGKKKAKAVDKEYDSKKKGAQQMTIKTVFTPTNDAKPLEFYEARAPKFHRTETQNIKSGNLKDMAQELVCDGIVTADDNVVNPGDSLASKEYPPEGFSSDTSGHRILTAIGVKECKAGDQVHSSTESSLRIKDGVPVPSEKNDVGRPVNEEGVSMGIHNSNSNGRHSPSVLTDIQKSEQSDEGLTNATSDFKGNHTFHNSNSDTSMSFAETISKVKAENDFGNTGEVLPYNSSPSNDVILALDGINKITQDPRISGDHMSENIEMVNVVASSRQSHDLKVHDVDRCPAAVSDQHIGKADELSGSPCQLKQELQSTESSIPVQREPSEPKYGSILTEEPLKSSGTILSPSITSSQRKVLSNVGKSCSPSSTVMISKSSISDNLKHADSHNLNCVTKHSAMNSCTISMKKENTANDAVRDEDRLEILRRAVKERPKSSVEPTSKASNHNKISHTVVSKQTMADSKDSISSKTSAVNVDVNLAVGQPIGSEQTQRGLTVENKVLASCLPHRGEKFSQSSCPLSSKLNHVLAAFPPAPSKGPAGLSDEELALLLHQELNSSPRVPRVPRMRQTGSLPQLASSTATCMQFKRSSSLAGKDNIMVSRRRTKDVCRDGTRSSRNLDDAKKLDRKSSSPDQRKPDLLCTLDASSNRIMYDDSSNLVHSVAKNISPSSSMATSGGVSYSMDAHNQSLSYMWNSPRNISDDDTGSTDAFSYQTLPGLLSEIMSKGKRMTYEELCNEVLPHWPNLRKHNGERYAYSSHSQAVLDCLRNRTEWAQLVDRGPKTNTNKKRRKVDVELEDECGKSVYAEAEGKSLETREFPKGKRKARKRRRLILQGRETKDVRKTRKACLLSDDDYALSSNSSEESVFSEDETQEGGTCRAESEASASSDEPGTTL